MKNYLKLPIYANILFFFAFFLYLNGIIPEPSEIMLLLEGLYERYSYTGLFFAALFEGIVYLSIYIPGTAIIILACLFSDGSFKDLFFISLSVSLALTLSNIFNYYIGEYFSKKKKKKVDSKLFTKGYLLSFLDPTAQSFYFYHLGLERGNVKRLFFIFPILLPLGIIVAFIFYSLRETTKQSLENPYALMLALLFWLGIAFMYNLYEMRKK
jgi:hypothetical protein